MELIRKEARSLDVISYQRSSEYPLRLKVLNRIMKKLTRVRNGGV